MKPEKVVRQFSCSEHWADIVALFKDYQTLQAIENFEDEDIKVAIGNDKKSVTIETSVQVINAMEKLYMTVVVE